MKAEQVDQALRQKFVSEGARLVFWHDAKSEFADYVGQGFAGEIADVQVLDVSKLGGLSAKLRLEREDSTGRYLVYSQGDAPAAEEDWLLDIRLYSSEFHADIASLWLQDLGLTSLSLRDHLQARAAFLGNLERFRKLARLTNAKDDEASLDLKMMAVLVGSSVASPFAILRAICHRHTKQGCFVLSEPPEDIASFEKMGLLARFWELMNSEFTYTATAPSVAGLLRQLFISELLYQTGEEKTESLTHYQLPAAGSRNAVVFLTQWRDSSTTAASHDAVAAAVAEEQKVTGLLAGLGIDNLKEVYTFWEAEKRVASCLKDEVLSGRHSVNVDSLNALVSKRKSGHWLSGPGSDDPERLAIADAYDAVLAAAGLFALQAEHRHLLSFKTPDEALDAYQLVLHHFDRLYRRYCSKARLALARGWDLLKVLTKEVEALYDQGFVQPLGIEWSRLLDEGFLETWSLKNLPAQQNFYARTIQPHLVESERKRAFVIISDAFRYEAARELTELLNGVEGMAAELSAMLGVLPSYTELGMASLLPRKTLAYGDKSDVLVDGKPVATTEARSKQLATVQGMACQAKELVLMKTDEAREFTKDKRVVYIYHNMIDSRGDSASTESETFEAVSDCIGELVTLAQFCVNKFNASKVWITADHGFLFQQDALDGTDKSQLSQKPGQAVKIKKRYVIGRQLGATSEAHHGTIQNTAGADGAMEFWVPRAANRFHFTGGARYVHGGAMPQEVVVPLVTVSQLRGKKAEKSKVESVSVHVLGNKHKITTPSYRFELIQTEAVSERRTAIKLRAAVYDGATAVTSVETVTFDSTSDTIAERTKSVRLELRSGTYDKSKPYRLVLRDHESEAEIQSVPVVIDRSFDDDF